MVRLTETAELADGLTIKELAHHKCRSCGSRFFDDGAMHRIQAARAENRRRAETR